MNKLNILPQTTLSVSYNHIEHVPKARGFIWFFIVSPEWRLCLSLGSAGCFCLLPRVSVTIVYTVLSLLRPGAPPTPMLLIVMTRVQENR